MGTLGLAGLLSSTHTRVRLYLGPDPAGLPRPSKMHYTRPSSAYTISLYETVSTTALLCMFAEVAGGPNVLCAGEYLDFVLTCWHRAGKDHGLSLLSPTGDLREHGEGVHAIDWRCLAVDVVGYGHGESMRQPCVRLHRDRFSMKYPRPLAGMIPPLLRHKYRHFLNIF